MTDKVDLSYQAFLTNLADDAQKHVSKWPKPQQEQLKRAYEAYAKRPGFDEFQLIEMANSLSNQRDEFFKKTTSLPDGFEIGFLMFYKRPKKATDRLRKEFNNKVKGQFLEFLAYTKPARLKELGLTSADIDKMKDGVYPAAKIGKNGCFPLINVEHVIPISGGGGNGFDNLYLVPEYINSLTAWVVNEQTRGMKEGERKIIIVLVPTKGPRQGYNIYPAEAPRSCKSLPDCKCA